MIHLWNISTYFSCSWEQVRMITTLLQIHHDVQQRHLLPTTFRIQSFEVPRQNIFVVFLLHRRQLHSDDKFGFRRHVLQHVGLQSSQHVRSQHFVQFFDLILFRNVGEFVLEGRKVIEFLTVEEVQQMEQFFEVVLQRCTS